MLTSVRPDCRNIRVRKAHEIIHARPELGQLLGSTPLCHRLLFLPHGFLQPGELKWTIRETTLFKRIRPSDAYPLNESGPISQVTLPETLNFDGVFYTFKLGDDALVQNNVAWPLQQNRYGVGTFGVDDQLSIGYRSISKKYTS